MSSSSSSKVKALQKVVKRLPAQMVYYGSALGAIVLAGGGQLPPGLEFVAGGIGANLLSNLVDEIARGEDVLDDEIRRRAEDAITQSDIANLLTKQDFLQGYARLLKRLDEQRTISQDILDELRTGFSSVATSDQVEELKQLLLQLIDQPTKKFQDKTRVFISYARADDEPFVERLYHDLKDEFDVWWDRVSMPNRGLTFLQEIRDAIDHADRLLLVAGPRAFISDYVRDEWLYAYETYKGINIALRLGDYPDLPKQLSGFDGPDFRSDDAYEERLATLKRQLAEPVAPVGQFYNVPALPPHFLNRPEALATLRDLVIADVDKPTLISAEKRTTAVEGMGGIGKSVMATAFAHDRKVRFAFPDGIVWLTAGHKPSMYELYRAVGVALGDDLSNYPDESTARQNAQKALVDKKCLLILDDVWELPVGRAFRDLISGTSARLLITTRNLQINDVLNANEYRLNLIDESQATHYLRSWVGDDPDLETIAEKLGYLFLALKLAGARMKKDGLSGEDYLRTFDRVSRMKIDRQASDREDSLEASITLSVDAAFANAEDEKLLYHTFGIFPEDTPVPQQTVIQLWRHLRSDVDAFDLLETLNALVDLALVERNTLNHTFTLHDLLHSYTREKLGDRYAQTHRDFLNSYAVEEWHQLSPDEPYLWWYIAYHLIKAGQRENLQALLLNPDYLQTKLNITADPNTLIADCETNGNLYLIESALRMSTHILIDDLQQALTQLYGRLLGHRDTNEMVAHLLDAIARSEKYPAFLTGTQSLEPAGGPLLRILNSIGTCQSVVWSPDGQQAFSGCYSAEVWDNQSGHRVFRLGGHMYDVESVDWSSDGQQLITAADKTIYLWHIYDIKNEGVTLEDCRHILEGHLSKVNKVMWSPDGQQVVSASDDKTLRLWNANTGQTIRTFEGHTDPVNSVSWSPDGQQIISASDDKTLRLWNANTCQIIRIFEGHTSGVNSVSWSPDGQQIISASDDKTLRLWDVNTGQTVRAFEGHTRRITAVEWSPDGQYALSASWDKTVRLWRVADYKTQHNNTDRDIRKSKGHGSVINGLVFSHDGQLVVSASKDKTLRLWDVNTGRTVRVFEGHTGAVNGVAWSPDDQQIISASDDKTLRLWDVNTGRTVRVFEGHTSNIEAVGWSSDGQHIASVSDKTLHLWNAQSGVLIQALDESIARYRLYDQESLILSDELYIYQLVNGKFLPKFHTHKHDIWLPGLEQYCFTADEVIRTVDSNARWIFVAGDGGGAVHFLHPNTALSRLIDSLPVLEDNLRKS